MFKFCLLALALFATCQVDGGRLPTTSRFQRQEVFAPAPYPPSGFRPEGTVFELPLPLPSGNELPEASVEHSENSSELETFNRLRTSVKSEKLVQSQPNQLQTNVASVSALQPLNYVQPSSPMFAKIQASPVQPELTPFNYAVYQQQAIKQGQLQQGIPQSSQSQQFSNQQFNGQVPVLSTQQAEIFDAQEGQQNQVQQTQQFSNQQLSGKAQPVPVFNTQQPVVFGAQVGQQSQVQQAHQFSNQQLSGQVQPVQVFNTQQPAVFGAQVPQPFYYSGQLQQPAFLGAQFQQSAVYGAQLQQPAFYNGELVQNYW